MEKISWTCPQCGMWHSKQRGDSGPAQMCTYDGLPRAEKALEWISAFLSERTPPTAKIKIVSEPMTSRPDWLTDYQKAAKDPRRLVLVPVDDAENPSLWCAMCGHDATDELKAQRPRPIMTSVEYK